MAERGDKRLCGGDSSKIRQRPQRVISLRIEGKKKNIRDQTKRIRVRAYYIVPSRLELTLDYCHATRHARWRKGGVIDMPRKAPRVKGKNRAERNRVRACVGGCPAKEKQRIKGRKIAKGWGGYRRMIYMVIGETR